MFTAVTVSINLFGSPSLPQYHINKLSIMSSDNHMNNSEKEVDEVDAALSDLEITLEGGKTSNTLVRLRRPRPLRRHRKCAAAPLFAVCLSRSLFHCELLRSGFGPLSLRCTTTSPVSGGN